MSRNANNVVWDYFNKNVEDKIAECNICKKNISFKTTITNLKQHLKLKHISAYNECLSRSLARPGNSSSARVDQPTPTGSAAPAPEGQHQQHANLNNTANNVGGGDGGGAFNRPRQRTLASYLPRQLRPEEKKQIDKSLLKLMTLDFQPFSIVEDERFKEFVAAVNPSYELPSRKTLSNALLSSEYTEKLGKVQTLVQQQCVSICATVDCWTSKNLEAYMAVTGHFINKETLEFHSTLIQCAAVEGSHTGERIANELRVIFAEWAISDRVNFMVTDNAANMKAAARILEIPHFGCFAHKLNLIVQTALANDAIAQTIAKVQRTVSHFKRSTIAKEKLLKYQMTAQNISQPRSLLLAVPTRWNSTYQMLERFVTLQEALKATIPNLNVDLPVIPSEEWNSIAQICEVLKPFEDVTKIISGETYLIASKALVLITGLNSLCDQLLQRNFFDSVNVLIEKLKQGIEARFGEIEKNQAIGICTLLDPRFKQHAFEDQALMLRAKTAILNKVIALQQEEPVAAASSVSDPLPCSSLWEIFDQKIVSSRQPRTAEEKSIEELNMYFRENILPRTECPIKWWKEHRTIYPSLYQIFIAYSNITVTSVPCERAFSKAGYMISDRRTRLTTAKVKKLMFLNSLKKRR